MFSYRSVGVNSNSAMFHPKLIRFRILKFWVKDYFVCVVSMVIFSIFFLGFYLENLGWCWRFGVLEKKHQVGPTASICLMLQRWSWGSREWAHSLKSKWVHPAVPHHSVQSTMLAGPTYSVESQLHHVTLTKTVAKKVALSIGLYTRSKYSIGLYTQKMERWGPVVLVLVRPT